MPMGGSAQEVVPREELDKAYVTIATLTAMLDKELSIIEKLSEGEVRVTREEVVAAGKAEIRDEVPKAPYVGAEEVMKMLGCSKQIAYRRLREFGAASVGHKLIAKRAPFAEWARERGYKVG